MNTWFRSFIVVWLVLLCLGIFHVSAVAAPETTAAPAGGYYHSAQSVTLTCSEASGPGCAATYYTTDGSTPASSAMTIVQAAYGEPMYYNESSHSFQANTPQCTAASNSYSKVSAACNGTRSCSISASNGNFGDPCVGAYKWLWVVYQCSGQYFISRTNENLNASMSCPGTSYSGPIGIGGNTTLKFLSTDLASASESVKTATYTFDVTTPVTTASPAGGFYGSPQNVSLSCTDSGSGCQTTYYCLGSGCSPSTLYTGSAIGITDPTALRYYSTDGAGNAESVKETDYFIKAPTLATTAASGITTGSATINGTVNVFNAASVVSFEYGLTTAYGFSVTAAQSPLSNNGDTAVSAAISGLTPGATYHYRVLVTNNGTTFPANDAVFTTQAGYTLTLTRNGSGSGTITPTGCSTVDWTGVSGRCTAPGGSGITLAGAAGTGSFFAGWNSGSGSATACTGTDNCSFSLGQDSALTGTFPLRYTVTVSSVTNGIISPTAAQIVNEGATTNFKIIPATGYHVVIPLGGSCPAGTYTGSINDPVNGISYTTGAITGNCDIQAAFAINSYTVTPSAGTGGSITPATPQTFSYNATTPFTIKPNAGYHVITPVGGTCGGSYNGNPFDTTNGISYTTSAITADCTVAAIFAPNACLAPMAWWRAEGNTDSSVGGYTGSLVYNAGYAAGKVGQGFSFDNSGCTYTATDKCSYVQLADNDAFKFAGRPFSISAWVKIPDTTKFTGEQGFGSIFDAYGYRIDYAPSSGIIRLLGNGAGGSLISNSGLVTMINDTWYHVATVSNGVDTGTIYVNGVQVLTGTYYVANYSGAPRIGECQNIGGAPFNGLIDEVQVYDRALSASEVQLLYSANGAGACSSGYNVTIGSGPSTGGAWSGSSPAIWTPSASGSTVSVSDIQSRLSNGVIISTAGNGTEKGDITVAAPLAWNSGTLVLDAIRDININAVMTASVNSGLDMATPTGTVKTGSGGKVNFDRSGTGLLTINGVGSTVINDATALQAISSSLTGTYALGADFDASSITNFVPLGDATTKFTGIFDGLGHTISGLTINRPTTNYIGLFGYTSGASLRNVGLLGGSISGNSCVGGLVGQNGGTGSSTISNVYNTGSVTGSGNYAGGLVGWNFAGTIDTSYNSGAVNGSAYVGGLVGENYTTANLCQISNSYSSGSVHGDMHVGGLAGFSWGDYANVYSSGAVTATTTTNVGGLLGGKNAGTITNGFWDKTVNASLTDIGLGTGATTADLKTGATFSGWNISASGGASTIWRIYEGESYPLLRSFLTPLTVTADDKTKTYDGNIYSGGYSSTYAPADYTTGAVLGSLAFSGDSQTATAIGSYTIIPSGLYSSQQGYDISYVNGALNITAPPPSYTLTINFAGDGGNKVDSTAPDHGINCDKGSPGSGCSASYVTGTAVTLQATADWKSTFIGWSGDYNSSNNPGTVTVDANKTVTATFDSNFKAKVNPGGALFASIQDAYASAPSGSMTIQAQAWSFLEDLLFANGTAVTLTGGMDSDYNPTSGYATVKSLTMGTGSAVIGNITIK